MNNANITFVFFGSGPVAAESLRLLANTFTIEAIVTKPSTEQEMHAAYPSAPVHTVKNRRELDLLLASTTFQSRLAVLIDFGIIVSQKIIDSFEKGIINSHFSLLPELRGADPITFAILEDKKYTGVSLMLLVAAMDEGPLLGFDELPISPDETNKTLTHKLVHLSYKLLCDTLPAYVFELTDTNGKNTVSPRSQEEVMKQLGKPFTPTYTRKLTKNDGQLDWLKPASVLAREIRAFVGWPKSRCTLANIDCVITSAEVVAQSGVAGEMFIIDKKLGLYCGEDALLIEKIKPAGKKEMSSTAFLAGYRSRLGL